MNTKIFTNIYRIIATRLVCLKKAIQRHTAIYFNATRIRLYYRAIKISVFGNSHSRINGISSNIKILSSQALVIHIQIAANTSELLCALYGEYADSARYGSSLRVLISDAKHTFSELEIQNFFSAEYNNFRINPEAVKCDYYDFLSGDKAAKKLYAGQFMSQYSWAEETAAFLERKALAG